MRALQTVSLDGPDGLAMADVPVPAADDEVLIEVHTAGVTFPDLLMTQGKYQLRPALPFAPGLEVAGIVHSTPAGVDLVPGDRVAAYAAWGGYAEMVSVPAHQVVSLPDTVDFIDGVSLMVNYQTAYFALARRGRLQADEKLLVHGAAGGVGTAAIQVGLGLGAKVVAVARGAEKIEIAQRAGAEQVIDATGDWLSEVKYLTDGRGADVIFDPVGGDRFSQSLHAVAPGGRLLVIGFADGRIPQIPANQLLLKNVSAVGVAWGMFISVDPGMPRAVAAEVAGLVASGHVRPIIGATYPLEQGAAALQDLAERRTVGKTVLLVR